MHVLPLCEFPPEGFTQLALPTTDSELLGDDSRYRNAVIFLNGRLPTVPGMNCPTIQYEARSSCCTVPSPVEKEIVDSDSFALRHTIVAKMAAGVS
ncbi:UNVERIFIED_CONTAM: hypothetical protein FKN15_045408 [Acipenser sinensis]